MNWLFVLLFLLKVYEGLCGIRNFRRCLWAVLPRCPLQCSRNCIAHRDFKTCLTKPRCKTPQVSIESRFVQKKFFRVMRWLRILLLFISLEVELDKNRLWCPNRNCETICSVGPTDKPSSSQTVIQQPSSSLLLLPRSVLCPTCFLEFCSSCKKPVRLNAPKCLNGSLNNFFFNQQWHASLTCEENSRKSGGPHDSMMLFDNDMIKCCPMCAVPIEKDEGCAQMMCKRCKHVFCWYCLASLDVSWEQTSSLLVY